MHQTRLTLILLAALAGVLADAGLFFGTTWFLSIPGLALFFFLLWNNASSWRRAALVGGIFGLLTAGAGLLPILDILPRATLETLLSFLGSASLMWLLPTVTLASATVGMAVSLYLLRQNIFVPLLVVPILILHDELRMWAWALLTYGEGAVLEPHLSLTALGYTLAESPYLLQLAQNVGLYGLTSALALFAGALAAGVELRSQEKKLQLRALSTVAIALAVLCLPLFFKTTTLEPREEVRVAIFSLTVDKTSPSQNPEQLLATIRSETAPDVILIPEGKWFNSIFPDAAAYEEFSEAWLPKDKDTLIIHSSESTEAGVRHNTVTYDSTARGKLATQHKRFVMPQGEYLPVLSKLLLPESVRGAIGVDRGIQHGTELVSVPFGDTVFGTLLCSEGLSTTLYRSLVQNHGAKTLINLADPAWFQGSKLLYAWTIRIDKVHAVQNQAYLLAAQNSAPSFVIDPSGRVIAETAWGAPSVLLVTIPATN